MSLPSQKNGETVPLWLWPNLLGLDSPLVAVSWQWLFARCFEVDFPPLIHLILGLSVWCVYLGDRIYDAWRTKDFTHATLRLRFAKKHFSTLIWITGVAALANLFLICRFVPTHLLIHGSVTAVLLAAYYIFRFGFSEKLSVLIPREILCGMVFAIGSAIATFSYSPSESAGMRFIGAVSMLGLVCSASCIMISVWERDADLASGDPSIASARPGIPLRVRRLLMPLVILYGIMALADPWQIHIAAGLAAFALYLMARFEKNFRPSLLRSLADGVLLTPLVFVWFA